MIKELTKLISEEAPEVQEAVLELLKALKEARGKNLDINPVQVLRNDAELISGLASQDDLDFSDFSF